jgi:uncharacterized protein
MIAMSQHDTDRRKFLQASAAVAASAATLRAQDAPKGDAPKADAVKANAVIPKRKLGKTGVEITMLDQGAVRGPTLDRILRFSYSQGVRVFDTAKVYGSEPNFKKWFDAEPTIRKEIFLVTKDELNDAAKMVASVDQRLKTLGTDYIDLFFLHGLGDTNVGGPEHAVKLVKSPEFAKAVDTLKKAGKIKFVGFSSHHKERASIITAAAEAGSVDAIMLQYRPWLDKETPLNKALDAAHAKGIGLISMKQIAGPNFGDAPRGNVLEEVAKKAPILKEKGLTPFQGLLYAIWSDERISSVCVSMRNTDQIRENVEASRKFEPFKVAELEQIRSAFLAANPTLCADCDGRCSVAAGTGAELGNLTRFLTYHQQLGDRSKARAEYAKLSVEARNWAGADLEAARAACPSGLDFARLLPEADRHLA